MTCPGIHRSVFGAMSRLALPLISIISSCTHTSPIKKKEPVEEIKPAVVAPAPVAPAVIETKPAEPVLPPGPSSTVPPDCQSVRGFPNDEPVFVKSAGAVLTRIASPCDLADGTKGHSPTGGWMAMGFPCTGGEGRIDWKGTNYNVPKMVSFLLDTSCPMANNNPTRLTTLVRDEVGVNHSAPMIAYNPFVVQYWEIPGTDEADATFAVELRNVKTMSHTWGPFIKMKPLKVFLVGRENAWVPGNNMYAVEAELNWASKNRFTMKVLNARVLKGDEFVAVKARCEALRPERECGKVF